MIGDVIHKRRHIQFCKLITDRADSLHTTLYDLQTQVL